eukprot:jgi/Mesvir1/27618/Mv07351-RA.1
MPDTHSQAKSRALTAGTTLEQVASMPFVGTNIFLSIPLLHRTRLRAVSPSFRSVVDASLAVQTTIDAHTCIGDSNDDNAPEVSARCGRALPWLLSKCPNLESLAIESKWMRGLSGDEVLHAAAAHCHQLQRLFFREARCGNPDDEMAESLQRMRAGPLACRALLQLDVPDTSGVTDAGIIAVANSCPLLQQLGVSGCRKVTDAGIIVAISVCERLNHLEAARTGVGDRGMLAISQLCPGMVHLDVNSCPNVTAAGITAVALSCPILEVFLVSVSGESDGAMRVALRYGKSVTWLCLNDAYHITDAAFVDLGDGCRELRELVLMSAHRLGGISITDHGVASLARNCHKLTHVDIDVATILGTDACMIALAENSPGLKHFSVRRWAVTDAGIKALALHCPLLTSLRLEDCRMITDEGLSQMVAALTDLEVVNLENTRADTRTVIALGSKCSKVTELNIGKGLWSAYTHNCGLDDTALAAVLQGCPNLRTLNITRCAKITGAAFVVDGMRQPAALAINELKMEWCSGFKPKEIADMVTRCPSLISLQADHCTGMTDDSVKTVVSGCKALRHLSIRHCRVTAKGMKCILSNTGSTLQEVFTSIGSIPYDMAA